MRRHRVACVRRAEDAAAILTDADNPLLRIVAFCARHEDDPAAQWLEAGVWAHVRGEGPLDACLGIRNPRGGLTWRDQFLTQRRDDLIRGVWLTHFHALTPYAASWKIATDFALFRHRVWPRLMFGGMPVAYTDTPSETYWRLMVEGHDVPGPRQLLNILRNPRPLPCAEDGAALSADGDRPDPAGDTAQRSADAPRPRAGAVVAR